MISRGGADLPGRYDREGTAHYAFQFTPNELTQAQMAVDERAGGKDGVITMDDLRDVLKRRKVEPDSPPRNWIKQPDQPRKK